MALKDCAVKYCDDTTVAGYDSVVDCELPPMRKAQTSASASTTASGASAEASGDDVQA